MQSLYNDKEDISKLLDILIEESKIKLPWVQRKEEASWLALLFYFAILWSLSQMVLDKQNIFNIKFEFSFYIIFFVPIFLWYLFFRFIHSQYSQYYYISAYTSTLTKIEFDILSNKEKFFIDNNIKDTKSFVEYIEKKVAAFRQTVQPYVGKIHPLRIVIHLWLSFIIKKFKKGRKFLSNVERQEASIYSLLTLSTAFYEFYIFKILC